MPSNSTPDASDTRSTIKRVLNGSRVVDAVQCASNATASRLGSMSARLRRVISGSYLYRWLTAEPDPEVIVIDLRETHTVGPVISLLDSILDALAPGYRQSRLADGVNAVAALGAAAADTRPGRVLAALFEPPESPEHRNEECDDVDPIVCEDARDDE